MLESSWCCGDAAVDASGLICAACQEACDTSACTAPERMLHVNMLHLENVPHFNTCCSQMCTASQQSLHPSAPCTSICAASQHMVHVSMCCIPIPVAPTDESCCAGARRRRCRSTCPRPSPRDQRQWPSHPSLSPRCAAWGGRCMFKGCVAPIRAHARSSAAWRAGGPCMLKGRRVDRSAW